MNTTDRYFHLAVSHLADTVSPAFKRVAKSKTVEAAESVRAAANAALGVHPNAPRQAIVDMMRQLEGSKHHWTHGLKQLASGVAFAAHVDLCRMERGSASWVGKAEAEQAFMGGSPAEEAPEYEDGDVPLADRGGPDADSTALPDGVVAGSTEDAYAAVHDALRALYLLSTTLPAEDAEYWGLADGVPLGSVKLGDGEYRPILDFAEYRELEDQRWREKQRVVPRANAKDAANAFLQA